MTTACARPVCWRWRKPCGPFGKVTVLAPDHNWSVSGHVKTLSHPLRVRSVVLDDGSPALTTDEPLPTA